MSSKIFFFKCFDLQGQGGGTDDRPKNEAAQPCERDLWKNEKRGKKTSLSGGGRGAEATAGDTAIDLQAA